MVDKQECGKDISKHTIIKERGAAVSRSFYSFAKKSMNLTPKLLSSNLSRFHTSS
jgi:hypothetical protein